MSDWLTYELSDFLLFSPRTYYRLFELYNLAVWPGQIVAIGFGLAILVLWLRGGVGAGRASGAILAACWAWVAWAYLLDRYDTINWAAKYFAVGFGLQALLLAWLGIVRNRLAASPRMDVAGGAGLCLFVFGLMVHPLIAPLAGRPWLQAELFGLTPDPTVIATLGVVLAAERPSWRLLSVALAWCAISGATLWTMQSPEALVTPGAGALALALAAWKTWRRAGGTGHDKSALRQPDG
jgi:hypothetical protein